MSQQFDNVPQNYFFLLEMNPAWSVLYDQVSGYPYYWNPQTNEVRWEKPPEVDLIASSRLQSGLEKCDSEKVND